MVAEETSSENAFETTLTAPMGPTDLVAAVVTKGSLTSTAILVIEPDDDAQREIIRFNGGWGASTFVTQSVAFRYLPGSAAPSGLTHPSGAIVRSVPTAQHIEDLNDRLDTLDHGDDLAGLGDDDHTQYHTDTRGDARYVELAGDTMTGLLTLSGDPDTALKAATKQYVDNAVDNADKGLRQLVIFTSNGTFTEADFTWLRRIRVRVGGGGGGGGGSNTDDVSGGGGGGGGYAEALIEAASLAASETVTIGAAGSAGIGAADGGAGGETSFGTLCVAGGGGGGNQAGLEPLGGNAGAGTTGDIQSDGQDGSSAGSTNATGTNGGDGGASLLGGGGRGGVLGAGTVRDGAAGGDFGGGGGGGARTVTSPADGGAGFAGIVIVELYA